MSGVRRYEDELALRVRDAHRIQRSDHPIFGSTVASWLFGYPAKGDLVHATYETAIVPYAIRFRPPPLVVTCHGLIPLRYPSLIEDTTTKMQWNITPKLLSRADAVIAVSEFTRDEILELTDVPREKIVVIYHGGSHVRPDWGVQVAPLKEKFGLDPDDKHVLVMSANKPQKRIDLVIETGRILHDRDSSIKVVKAGYGEGLDEDFIVNTGWVQESDLLDLYRAADVYFHPSEYESFGLPILEAMRSGTPVVASNRGSIPEVLGDEGTMIDLDRGDVAELFADAIESKLHVDVDWDAHERGSKFTWTKAIDRTQAVYDEVLS